MKTCKRAVNFIQIMNAEGDVRACSWNKNNVIGNLLENDINEILHGKRAELLRRQASVEGNFVNCDADNCPYLANNRMDEILIDIDEIPDYPEELFLAYEGVCNYNCTCCTSYQHMEDTRRHDYSQKYELLERQIKKILPHVRHISANGRGELFASKRILKLLSEWEPIAPPEEIKVSLETNGSMFDEKHWKQIENLGQYHLNVAITVMSFDEMIYQHLSGTKLSIDRLENNLKFVKNLREQGVINYLELATVLQEENFREMPEFTRRCIDEFGGDIVRIRPIMPGGIYDRNIQWFMDVRNPEHPYYAQYMEIMKHPVFQNPKVLLWSGDLPSLRGMHPLQKAEEIRKAVEMILEQPDFMQKLAKRLKSEQTDEVFLYGIGTLGKLLIRLNRGELFIKEVYDQYSDLKKWNNIPVRKPECAAGKTGTVIVTTCGGYEDIKNSLTELGFNGNILSLYDLVRGVGLC